MLHRLTIRVLFTWLSFRTIAGIVRETILPETLPHFSVSAFEKNYLASISEEVASDRFYGGNAMQTVKIRNVGFGVFGAKNVSVGFTLQGDAVRTGNVQFRIDGENGQIISALKLSSDGSSLAASASAPVTPVKGYHDLYVSYSSEIKGNFSWFQFEVSGPNPEEYYVLTSLANGQAISAVNVNPNQHTFVHPFTYGQLQMMRFTKTLVGSYIITTRESELNLDIHPSYLFNSSGYLMQSNANSKQSQEWYIDPAEDGSVKLMSRLSGRCVTITPTANPMYVFQDPCLNQTNQKWYFMPVC